MTQLSPRKIAEVTGGKFVGNLSDLDIRVAGAARDSRDVIPGNLFICIRGSRVDGHSFANAAFDAGAACCLCEQSIQDAKGPYVLVESTLEAIKQIGAYYRSLFDIPVIGITGSVGKTTTKEMTAAVLGVKYKVLKTPENLNNELGVPLTILSLDSTHEAAVIEMGISDFGEMSRLAKIVKPDICIITAIGYSHIETLGSLQGVLQAKTEVFAYMDSNSAAILNGDDELLWEYDPGVRKITFWLGERNDIRAHNVSTIGTSEVAFEIERDRGRIEAKIPSYGNHLAPAALAATAAGDLLGLSDKEITQGLLKYVPVGGRSNVADTGYITLIDDCYNANPNSVTASLTSLASLPGRRIAILGDMLDLGAQSEQMHHGIGCLAARSGIDCVICNGEKAEFIYKGYISEGGTEAHYFKEKADLISALSERIKKGDAVLVKASHGMKFEEILPFLRELR